MKKLNLLIALILFISSALLISSCKKTDNDPIPIPPTEAEIIENNIQALLDSIIENTHVPGLVAGVWAPDEGIDFVYTAGVSDLETQAPMSEEMVFRIASNTKTFAITVLLQLVDEGELSLDDKLSQYLSDFPRGDEVTIEMLTNMRSGIYNYVESMEFWQFVFLENPTYFWTVDEIIDFTLEHHPGDLYYFDPGTDFHYSNTNTIIIEYIIEKVTGKSLESLVNERIIIPLSLEKTIYLIGGTEIPGYHSKAYYFVDYDEEFPELSEYLDYSFARAAGGMISDIFDLKTYVQALTGDYFLTPSLQTKRMDGHSTSSTSVITYGMGMLIYNDFYGHNGGAPGYTSLMMHSPERNCTIVIWYNSYLGDADPTQLLFVIPQMIYPDF
ncbi:MAG: beta-lactamase family protein [Bacteroidales bacterium]|nr:beta-lactamase family protein [Bacteroidales bacterium]